MSTISDSTTSSSWTALQQKLAAADTNADGVVGKDELIAAASEDPSLAQAIVSAADSDGDGTMSLMEFTGFADTFSSTTGLSLLSAQEGGSSAMVHVFAGADTDGSATLTGNELAAALTAATTDTTATTSEDTSAEGTGSSKSQSDGTDGDSASADVKAAIAAVDKTGDGTFDARDVAVGVLLAAAAAQRTEQLSGLDQLLDANGDGLVTMQERLGD